jgi:8-oxo-dGTP pyrophosphatase MutT (NUDIX family)
VAEERAAGLILFREGADRREYLIIKNRGGGHWGFPKGHVEEGEDLMATALREVAEEVSITRLRPVSGFRERIAYRFDREGRPVDKEVILFLAAAEEPGAPSLGEVEAMRWLPYPAALEQLTHAEQREALRRAEAFLAGRHSQPPKEA